MSEFKSTVPFTKIYAVVPSDGDDLPDGPARSLYIGVAGTIKVTTIAGITSDLPNHPVGYLLGQISRVWDTGTSADEIRALA